MYKFWYTNNELARDTIPKLRLFSHIFSFVIYCRLPTKLYFRCHRYYSMSEFRIKVRQVIIYILFKCPNKWSSTDCTWPSKFSVYVMRLIQDQTLKDLKKDCLFTKKISEHVITWKIVLCKTILKMKQLLMYKIIMHISI